MIGRIYSIMEQIALDIRVAVVYLDDVQHNAKTCSCECCYNALELCASSGVGRLRV
jgi:hypothetical protein